jgi:hypothetical protein
MGQVSCEFRSSLSLSTPSVDRRFRQGAQNDPTVRHLPHLRFTMTCRLQPSVEQQVIFASCARSLLRLNAAFVMRALLL